MIATFDCVALQKKYLAATPFNHVTLDSFFPAETARLLAEEFHNPSEEWARYDNSIERKKLFNTWQRLPDATYRALSYLMSPEFVATLESITNVRGLRPDYGLHGGGWHLHERGEKLNVHMDYSLHPKLHLQRKLNLIVYLTPDWKPEWGGQLGLWSHNPETNQPLKLIHSIDCLFNRAVLFDTTQNSWHGLPDPISCPAGVMRRSIALYYLIPATDQTEKRYKALFAPTEQQKDDPAVLDLIRRRSGLETAKDVYF